MSLAMFAAPFNDNNDNNDNYINKKRVTHNKTQKRYTKEGFNSDKVNSILEKIHEQPINEEDNLGDFVPPPPPQSSGVQRTITNEQIQIAHNNNNKNSLNPVFAPQPNNEEENSLDLNNYKNNYGDQKTAEEYYKNMMANYNMNTYNRHQNMNKQYYTSALNNMAENSTNDVLLKKINYMINLLEEQQDERTNNVTEEVILYSFLGIFIIFIADSFAKIGKYVR